MIKKYTNKIRYKLIHSHSNFERFIKSINTGQNDQPDFKRGAEIQKVIDSCFESAKTNTWVNI